MDLVAPPPEVGSGSKAYRATPSDFAGAVFGTDSTAGQARCVRSGGHVGVGSQCTHVAIRGTRVARTGLFLKVAEAKIRAKTISIARHRPREPTPPG